MRDFFDRPAWKQCRQNEDALFFANEKFNDEKKEARTPQKERRRGSL